MPSIARTTSAATSNIQVLKCATDRHLWSKLREYFRLIVLDNPAIGRSGEGLIFSALADATVLVIEAEATRSGVAQNAVAELSKSGANVVGFIFNKRRYYIPEAIYRHL